MLLVNVFMPVLLYLGSNLPNTSYNLYVHDGQTFLNNTTAASANNLSSQLIVANTGGTGVAIELWRNGNASWQIMNDAGTLYIRNNWTTAKQTTYSQNGLIMDYNTGATSLPYLALGQTARNTSYKLYVNGTTWHTDHIYLAAAKHIHMSYNSTDYYILHNHNNGDVSVNAASAGLYMAYYNTTFVNWMDGRMELRDGCLSLFPNNTSYREGLRIHSTSNWSDITLCGNDNIGNTGTSANSWFIGNNNGNFYIARNGCSSSSSAILSCVSNVWSWNGTANGNINGNAATATRINGNLGAISSATNCNIWVSANASASGIPNYVSGVYVTASTGTIVAKAITASNGQLKATANSNTVTIGSQNASFCHIYNSVSIPFIFNNSIWTTKGALIGSTGQYRPYQLYLGYNTTADSRALDSGNPLIEFANAGRSQYAQIVYTDYNSQGGSDSFTFVSNQSDLRVYAPKVHGAVWNDYAECRQATITTPGMVVTETSSGTMKLSTERLMPACRVISDTYGMIIGETETAQTPIAVSGRVLVYTYKNRNEYPLGAAVCSAPNGTIDIMTRDEIIMYPERIIGTVSEIPEYDTWQAGYEGKISIPVNGRIWIYVR